MKKQARPHFHLDIHRQKDGRLIMTIGKKINGHSIIVSVVSSGRKSLTPKTAYIVDTDKYNLILGTKKDVKSQETTESQGETMPITSNNVPTITSSDDIITSEAAIVKAENASENVEADNPSVRQGESSHYTKEPS